MLPSKLQQKLEIYTIKLNENIGTTHKESSILFKTSKSRLNQIQRYPKKLGLIDSTMILRKKLNFHTLIISKISRVDYTQKSN